MRAGIAYIRKELDGIYPKGEIESMIFLIFEKLKGYSRTQFLLSIDDLPNQNDRDEISRIVERLKKYEPIQYIFGQTEFYNLSFYCNPGVLIPRPETEELVHWIIQENKQTAPAILDIGTGTGCIAISLKKNIENAEVFACDISPICIETAKKNARFNNTTVRVLNFDILSEQPEVSFPGLDIIVSNPPYVRETEKAQMEPNVLEYEPELALFVADNQPLKFYNRIADFAKVRLKSGGKLYFEINEAFGSECANMLGEKGFSEIILKKDINGKDRMISCRILK